MPGLAVVVAAIPGDMHSLAVDNFMTAPLADIGGGSPGEHLRTGGDPAVVVYWIEWMDCC